MQDMVEPEWQHPDTPGLSTGGPVRDRFQYSNWTAWRPNSGDKFFAFAWAEIFLTIIGLEIFSLNLITSQ